MHPVFAIASNITTSIGLDTAQVWGAVAAGRTGIRRHEDGSLSASPFWASRIDPAQWQVIQTGTRSAQVLSPLEQMSIFSARDAMREVELHPDRTLFILSTTKGNIEWLGIMPDSRNALTASASVIAAALGITTAPVVVSHACVSGVAALLYGLRQLQSGRYDHAVVTGADRFTRFVLNGFQSFQAIADGPCRPFDAERKGINLGEAAATIMLSTKPAAQPLARLCGGATSNDANHISGPSRTGEELAMAITRSMREAGVQAGDIGMISAHGTATVYNDEMESKAFSIAGLLGSGVHSMKGYVGHTLGAAGILESAMILQSLRRGQLIPSAGFESLGVSRPLHITTRMQDTPLDYVLKTASGFGGCNAAMIWAKA